MAIVLKIGNWGIGDELQMSAVAREWKKQDPTIELYIRANKAQELFINNPIIGPGHNRPEPDTWVRPETWRGRDNAAEWIGKYFGVTVTDRTPEIYLAEEEKEWARSALAPVAGRKILAVCGAAGGTNRAYPRNKMIWLVQLLHDAGFATVEIGRNLINYPNLHNTDMNFEGMTTLRQVAALLSASTAFVGVSTCLHLMAAAVGTPQVVIFRGVEAQSNSYKNTIAVEDTTPCDPRCEGGCFRNPPCIDSISPERIRDAVCSNFS